MRTAKAWPHLMQRSWNAHVLHAACAGGKVGDVRVQMNAMDAFFAQHRGAPQLITLTVGGNDVGFSDELRNCVLNNCLSAEARVNAKIDALEEQLVILYRLIRGNHPYADIVVGGYPDLVEVWGAGGNAVCHELLDGERRMISRLSRRLNDVISSAARRANVWSVGLEVRDAFAGHNACSGYYDEWIHSFVPAWGWPPTSPDSFHPKEPGQFHYAVAFSDAVLAYAGR